MSYLIISDYIKVCFAWEEPPSMDSTFNETPLILASDNKLYTLQSKFRDVLHVYINNDIDAEKLINKFNNIFLTTRIKSPNDLIKVFKNNNIIKSDIFNIDENDVDIEPDLVEIETINENLDNSENSESSENEKLQSKKLSPIQNIIINDYSNYISVSKSVAKIDKNNRVLNLIYDIKTNKLYYPYKVNYKQKSHHIKAQYYSIHLKSISKENINKLMNMFNEISDKTVNLNNCQNIEEQLLRHLISIIRNYKLIDNTEPEIKSDIKIIQNNNENNESFETEEKESMKINKNTKIMINKFIILQNNADYPFKLPYNFEVKLVFDYRGCFKELNKMNEAELLNKDKTKVKQNVITIFNSIYIDMNKFKELFSESNIRTINEAYYYIYKNKWIEQCLKKECPNYEQIMLDFEKNYSLNKIIIANTFNMFDVNNLDNELISLLLESIFTKIKQIEISIGITIFKIDSIDSLIKQLKNTQLKAAIDGGINSIKIISKTNGTFIFKNNYINKLIMLKIIEYYQSKIQTSN